MKRRNIYVVLGLIFLSCSIILNLQYHWFYSTRAMAKRQFRDQVLMALVNVVSELEKSHALRLAVRDSSIFFGEKLKNELPEFRKADFYSWNNPVFSDSIPVISFNDVENIVEYESDFQVYSLSSGELKQVLAKNLSDYQAIDGYLTDKLKTVNFDSIVGNNLLKYGIEDDFEYAVTSYNNLGFLIQSAGFKEEYLGSPYFTSLFAGSFIPKSNRLVLHFQNRSVYSAETLKILSLIFAFTLVVIFTLGLTVYVILKQKTNADIKADFINNMTHQFKTPSTSINLAADTIANPLIYKNPETIKHYVEIIKKESSKIYRNVESILQVSLMEKQKMQLKKVPSNVHDLIHQAVESHRFIIRSRGGEIIFDLKADSCQVKADVFHATNAFSNVIDNAEKYSHLPPKITIRTENRDGNINISIKDEGIGMSDETLKHIFDPFYRINGSDSEIAKGFGLGLSYVHYVLVKGHHGTIKVNSKKDCGTEFIIALPLLSK